MHKVVRKIRTVCLVFGSSFLRRRKRKKKTAIENTKKGHEAAQRRNVGEKARLKT